jgi:hypothetical protein
MKISLWLPRIARTKYFVDVVDALAGELLDPAIVRALKRREAAYIKWLEEV